MIDKGNIAIISTVCNFELYYKTSQLFPKDIKKLVIDGRNGMHGIHSLIFMFEKLSKYNIKWLIMMDEDVIVKNDSSFLEIIEHMKTNKIDVCGVRDGGAISHRNYNPFVINTFFSVLNFKQIMQLWNKEEVLKNQFINYDEFNDDLEKLKFKYQKSSLKEPYYCFYLWLRRMNKKMLFLNSKMLSDGISNEVLFQNKPILCHTWYARSYGVNKSHTNRIDALLSNFKTNSSNEVDYTYLKSKTFKIKMLIKKYIKKVQMKLVKFYD